jgi:hypothetical protein
MAGKGKGNGKGNGSGNGSGSENGNGNGKGNGNGSGSGSGNGNGNGSKRPRDRIVPAGACDDRGEIAPTPGVPRTIVVSYLHPCAADTVVRILQPGGGRT